MSNYTVSNDSAVAKIQALRWENCSEAARMHAAANCQAGILPHVVAEAFDAGFLHCHRTIGGVAKRVRELNA